MDNQSKSIKAYYAALEQLVKKNKRISLDAVALEAGRGRGAIKGDSPEIIKLKEAIIKAKNELSDKVDKSSLKFKLDEAIRIKNEYKKKYEEQLFINASLNKQLISTVYELSELKLSFDVFLKDKNNIIDLKIK